MIDPRLKPLQRRLTMLAWRRQLAGWGRGLAHGVLATAAMLLGFWLVDWTWEPNVPQRLALLAIGGGLLVGAQRRVTWPWLRPREDLTNVALSIERRDRLDNDLVAALQFSGPQPAAAGSPQLRDAVIDYVAEYGRELPVDEPGLWRPAVQRWAIVVVLGALALGAVWAWPEHWRAAAQRLLLATVRYPRHTTIERVLVNGRAVAQPATAGGEQSAPYGQPVEFQVILAGRIPDTGHVELCTTDHAATTRLVLQPDSQMPNRFSTRLPRLIDTVVWQLFIGDNWTGVQTLRVVPLPELTIALVSQPPGYTMSAEERPPTTAARQMSVVEGTAVTLLVECTNKTLRSGIVSVGDEEFALEPAEPLTADGTARRWRLSPHGTPLESIHETLQYQLQVTDDDQLQLAEPLVGQIRIKSDRPPRVTAAVVTQHVLPAGRPRIAFGAVDDYGIADVRLQVQVVHEDGSMREETIPLQIADVPRKTVHQRWPLDLAGFKLVKGDQLRLTVEATDYRGLQPGRSTSSEPLVLYVTDERGVLAAMAETDQRTARQMDLIIQRQLGIGE